MKMENNFPTIEIMPLADSLRLTPAERLRQNNLMANRWLEVERFTKELSSGWDLVQSQIANRKS
jgi:hypothetical protein